MIRIGLLGAARISDKAIFQPLKQLDGFVLQAVAASTTARARQYAGEHSILHVADSYRALLERSDIDLIYNALPPSEHTHWTIQALQQGKHVLCEKPFAEAQAMVQAAEASGKLLLEAFHYRFHPLFVEVMRLVQTGTIGTISHLRANFSVRIPYFAGSLRHEAALGGGAMMDLGCYPLHWVRTVMGSEPGQEPQVLSANCITASATTGGEQIDIISQAQLQFANGAIADIGTSMAEHLSRTPDTSLVLEGNLGSIEVSGLITPQQGNSIKVMTTGAERQYSVPGHSTYYYQLQHVQNCLQGRATELTGGADAISNMRLLDEIYQHAGLLSRGSCRS